ncbi:alkene reductase [Agreia sp. COWG]|uniref:alkene reductase n=1 Tax=Agreia sp. COWG TaxID=2773266 RepID=UPI001927286D|nr:alkene reductase [Agreia sp. COWG]CAD5989502.1 N-ethylmaleimide reductase [Agreia sp. COWG]
MQLFSPVSLGSLELDNRIVMAPLTRTRSNADGVPNDLNVEHYAQRASTGLIVTEGTYPTAGSQAYPGQPGIETDEQAAGWARVADAVHANGGKIVMQLMHGGRVTHPLINNGLTIFAPSAHAIEGVAHTPEGPLPYPVPTAATTDDIARIVAEHVSAARRAVDAGLDGVEVHSANGYLLHEFLSPVSNTRTDSYGGSPENRARFGAEVITAIAQAIGADRVGVRISPEHNIQDVLETDPDETRATYEALVDAIAPLGLAYLSVLHAEPSSELVQDLRARFGGAFLVNNGFGTMTTRDGALALVDEGTADAVVVGRPLIANPDLVRRWREDADLNEPNPATFYGSGPEGYTDYPTL